MYLKYGMIEKYPEPDGFDGTDLRRMFNEITNYKGGAPCGLGYFLWRDLYPFVYFDLRRKEPMAPSDDNQIVVDYEFNTSPGEHQTVHVALVRGVELEIQQSGNDITATLLQ